MSHYTLPVIITLSARFGMILGLNPAISLHLENRLDSCIFISMLEY